MVVLELRFPGGRYHATPWGHHANEAEVAWPPEPWRLLRALVAVWHRKADRERFPEPVLERLVEALAEELPEYRLPQAVHGHARHYMPVRSGKAEKRLLVFDGFARVDPDEPLVVAWPEVELDPETAALLDHLLERLGYLGRAESWVEARRVEEGVEDRAEEEAAPENGPRRICRPAANGDDSRAKGLEPVELLAAEPPAVYAAIRRQTLDGLAAAGLKGQRASRVRTTLPERYLDLLRLDTADFQAAGWSRPPGTRPVRYLRPAASLAPTAPRRGRSSTPEPIVAARFALLGRPLPRVEDTVRIGELARRGLMSKAGKRDGKKVGMPPVLSGKRGEGAPASGHRHAFFLPEDADGDGRLDHVLLYAADGLNDPDTRRAIAELETLWEPGGGRWRVLLEGTGPAAGRARPLSSLLATASEWISVTPYLHPWHRKPGFDRTAQLRRELAKRGFPELVELEELREIDVRRSAPAADRSTGAGRATGTGEPQGPGRPAAPEAAPARSRGRGRRPVHFRRFRSRTGGRLVQPDTHGAFYRLRFPHPVPGPLALGFACHYGLGLFRPAEPERH